MNKIEANKKAVLDKKFKYLKTNTIPSNYKEQVKEELLYLKSNLSPEQLSKLDIEIDPLDPNRDLYGKIFGSCWDKEVAIILNKATKPFSNRLKFFNNQDLSQEFELVDFGEEYGGKRRTKYSGFSALEFYMTHNLNKISNIVHFLKSSEEEIKL